MSNSNLGTGPISDFASLDLNYEAFRALANNPHLDAHGKIGFPTSYRDAYEELILRDILAKIPCIQSEQDKLIVDIGPGCANLPKMIIEVCRERGHRIILADSPEMLAQLPGEDSVIMKCPGQFPRNAPDIARMAGRKADAIICYSVLHYIFVDGNPFDFVDQIVAMLAPGGRALIGDIPNASKRKRFFASERGRAFHMEFTGETSAPEVRFNEPTPGKIDDASLAGLIHRAQLAGCDAYLIPQPEELPAANRRDDLLIVKP